VIDVDGVNLGVIIQEASSAGGAMTTRSKSRFAGRSIPIVKCELCGWDVPFSSVVQREMEGISHHFCSTHCEAEWESLDRARIPGISDAEPKTA